MLCYESFHVPHSFSVQVIYLFISPLNRLHIYTESNFIILIFLYYCHFKHNAISFYPSILSCVGSSEYWLKYTVESEDI